MVRKKQLGYLFLVAVYVVAVTVFPAMTFEGDDGRPETMNGPTVESLEETAAAYAEAFNARDWMALYQLEPPEFRQHCDAAEYAFTLEFAIAFAEEFLAAELGAEEDGRLLAELSNVHVIGTDGYVDVDILLDETLLQSNTEDPETDDPGWIYANGEWQRHMPGWEPEDGCAFAFFHEDGAEEDDVSEAQPEKLPVR